MTPTCDICGRPVVEHRQLRVELPFFQGASLVTAPPQLRLCYFCVRETLLQLLKQSEKLQDAASVNPNPQDPLCPANPTS